MRTIYYKEAPENPESLKVLLKHYFDETHPETYWTDSGKIQCRDGCNRSIDDLILLANHYFPGSTCKDVLNAYIEITKELREANSNASCIFFKCNDIDRPVMMSDKYYHLPNVDNYILYIPHLDYKSEKSEYTMRMLKEIIEND